MNLIPVIDIMGGRAVWARRGVRDDYAPLVSNLCPDSDPVALAHRFGTEYRADILYIADLDAITGCGHNRHLIRDIVAACPTLTLWVDAGVASRADLADLQAHCPCRPVIGSETLGEADLLQHEPHAVLSLDYRDGRLLGPVDLGQQLTTPSSPWSRDLILMSLHRVGSGLGPDLGLLADYKARFPDCRLHAAGGIRDRADLENLRSTGAAGVLLASALHDGRIGPADIAQLTH